jgi:hypothetical protein
MEVLEFANVKFDKDITKHKHIYEDFSMQLTRSYKNFVNNLTRKLWNTSEYFYYFYYVLLIYFDGTNKQKEYINTLT